VIGPAGVFDANAGAELVGVLAGADGGHINREQFDQVGREARRRVMSDLLVVADEDSVLLTAFNPCYTHENSRGVMKAS
jgi:hypothetical protein